MLKSYDNPGRGLAWLFGALVLLVYAGALFFPLMDKDAAHHAAIALRMYEHNDWVSLVDRQKDYLDKPHLLFWSTLLSFKVFGITTVAHRLPAILYALVSLVSVYRLARHLADRKTALLALLVLATAQGFIFAINDARMETPISAGITLALWQLIVYVDRNRLVNLVGGALGLAIAFSTKGWLGPVVALIGVFFHILFNGRWKVLLQPKTWLILPVFALLISPVVYAYYLQYDLHPEKVIRGQSNISGVKFILWNQLFERYTGFDEGGRNSSYFFLYHTFIWAFFPWSIIAYAAVVFWIRRIISRKWRSPFLFAAATFAFVLVTISASKFKMPHYIVMFLPFAALFTAPYLRWVFSKRNLAAGYLKLQMVLTGLLFLAMLLLNGYFFPPVNNYFVIVLGAIGILAFVRYFFHKSRNRGMKMVFVSAGFSILFNFFMNYNFFPQLMTYQGGNELVKKRENIRIADSSIVSLDIHAHSFDYYRGHNYPIVDVTKFDSIYPSVRDKYFVVTRYFKNYVEERGYRVEPVVSQPDYNVAVLKLPFLNPKTRAEQLDTLSLARIYKNQ